MSDQSTTHLFGAELRVTDQFTGTLTTYEERLKKAESATKAFVDSVAAHFARMGTSIDAAMGKMGAAGGGGGVGSGGGVVFGGATGGRVSYDKGNGKWSGVLARANVAYDAQVSRDDARRNAQDVKLQAAIDAAFAGDPYKSRRDMAQRRAIEAGIGTFGGREPILSGTSYSTSAEPYGPWPARSGRALPINSRPASVFGPVRPRDPWYLGGDSTTQFITGYALGGVSRGFRNAAGFVGQYTDTAMTGASEQISAAQRVSAYLGEPVADGSLRFPGSAGMLNLARRESSFGGTGFGTRGILQGLQELAQAGVKEGDLRKAARPLTNLALITGGRFGESADLLMGAKNIFGVDFKRAGDVIAQAANQSLLRPEDLPQIFSRAGFPTKLIGGSLTDTMAMAAAGRQVLMSPSVTSTGIRNVDVALADPKKRGILEDLLGESILKNPVTSYYTDKKGNLKTRTEGDFLNILDIMEKVQNKISKLPQSQQLNTLKQISGMWGLPEMAALVAPPQEGQKSLKELREEFGHTKNALEDFKKALMSTPEGVAAINKAARDNALAVFGDSTTRLKAGWQQSISTPFWQGVQEFGQENPRTATAAALGGIALHGALSAGSWLAGAAQDAFYLNAITGGGKEGLVYRKGASVLSKMGKAMPFTAGVLPFLGSTAAVMGVAGAGLALGSQAGNIGQWIDRKVTGASESDIAYQKRWYGGGGEFQGLFSRSALSNASDWWSEKYHGIFDWKEGTPEQRRAAEKGMGKDAAGSASSRMGFVAENVAQIGTVTINPKAMPTPEEFAKLMGQYMALQGSYPGDYATGGREAEG